MAAFSEMVSQCAMAVIMMILVQSSAMLLAPWVTKAILKIYDDIKDIG